MIDLPTLATLFLMAATTYLSRILGYLAFRGRTLSPRTQVVLESVPGCVLIAVIAPHFVSGRPADLLGLGMTVLLASRWPLLPTVVGSVAITAVLRHLIP